MEVPEEEGLELLPPPPLPPVSAALAAIFKGVELCVVLGKRVGMEEAEVELVERGEGEAEPAVLVGVAKTLPLEEGEGGELCVSAGTLGAGEGVWEGTAGRESVGVAAEGKADAVLEADKDAVAVQGAVRVSKDEGVGVGVGGAGAVALGVALKEPTAQPGKRAAKKRASMASFVAPWAQEVRLRNLVIFCDECVGHGGVCPRCSQQQRSNAGSSRSTSKNSLQVQLLFFF